MWPVRFVPGDAEQRVLRLARDVAAAPGQETLRLRPSALLAELAGRTDRRVDAWMAIAAPGDPDSAAGLIALVTAAGTTRTRHSISWLVVHPAFRRQGVGRLLVEQACSHAWECSATAVWVECRADWPAALGFWQAVGFHGGARGAG